MLTSAQVAIVAFVNDYGEFMCRDCAHDLFDQGDADGLRPVSQYELDEYVSEIDRWGLEEEDHVDGCTCSDELYCEQGGEVLVEAWTDPDCEEKRDEDAE